MKITMWYCTKQNDRPGFVLRGINPLEQLDN